jgi:hypothetical protein
MSPEKCLAPDILKPSRLGSQPLGSPGLGSGSSGSGGFNFTPIGPAPPPRHLPQLVRPIASNPEMSGHFKIKSVPFPGVSTFSQSPAPGASHKRKPIHEDMSFGSDRMDELEPHRKLHLTEDFVAQTMSELCISNPKPKVAKREFNRDVSEAINLDALSDLENKFSSQAINEEFSLPPLRNRKLPVRNRNPQLRLTLHQDLKSVRSNNVLPDSIISRYRPSPRQGSTALVLWKPPGSIIPDLIPSSFKTNRGRTRCFSEVTSTPYSSHENLMDSDSDMLGRSPVSNLSPISAEAPELSSPSHSEDDSSPFSNRHRRNSAPEISEPLPFPDDDGSMEL